MLNRRLIRIKTFQALFGELGQENSRPSTIISNVKKSIRGMGPNLKTILGIGPELSHYLAVEHNPNEFKYKPTASDIDTFNIITQNSFFLKIRENEVYSAYEKTPTLDWQSERDIMFLMYREFKKTDAYSELTSSYPTNYDHLEFVVAFYKYLILDSVEFEQLMEDENIYWYDEKIPILKSLEKIFEDYKESAEIKIPQLFRNEKEDLAMADDIVNKYFEHKSALQEEIKKYTPGWDSDRITKVDYLLILMALLEFQHMPMIPVKVTMNEYIEIAKMYSTPKSSKFVNGTLDKILKDWKEKGLISKLGRGLIG